MPVLSLFETVALINLFIQGGTDDAHRFSFHGKRICHFIAHYYRSYTLGLVFVYTVK